MVFGGCRSVEVRLSRARWKKPPRVGARGSTRGHPRHQAIRKLDNKNKLTARQYVPEMFADVIVALATQTTAEDKTAQLVDASAWVPKQMRLNFKKIQDYMHQNMGTPDWVTDIKSRRAKEASDLEEEAKAAAWKRMGGAAPGEPGGLANDATRGPQAWLTGTLHEGGIRSVRSPPRRAPLPATPIAKPLQCRRP